MHMRHKDIFGDTSVASVREANQTAIQVAVIIRLLKLRGVYVSIEQPKSSKLFQFPDIQEAIRAPSMLGPDVTMRPLDIYMGAFGHVMEKLCVFMTDLPMVFDGLQTTKPEGCSAVGTKKSGKWVSGTEKLKESQCYPKAFAEHFADLFMNCVWKSKPMGPVIRDDYDRKTTLFGYFKPKPQTEQIQLAELDAESLAEFGEVVKSDRENTVSAELPSFVNDLDQRLKVAWDYIHGQTSRPNASSIAPVCFD